MKTRFTFIGTSTRPLARRVNYEGKHSALSRLPAQTLVALIDEFTEKCSANGAAASAAAIPNYPVGLNYTRPLQFEYREGGAKHEGIAVSGIYRLDFQGFVTDAGHRANIALQWGRGNDNRNGGAAASVLMECGTAFSRKDLLWALRVSIDQQAIVYVSRFMAAQALEARSNAEA